MPNNYDCEALIAGSWRLISIDAGKNRARVPVRCPECKAAVSLHSKNKKKKRPHAEHRNRFTGCSRGDCFDGRHRPNPKAIGLEYPTEELKTIESEIETAVENDKSKRSGQGFHVSPEQRKQIERHAVNQATAYFESRGYKVKDVGSTRCWDLDCSRGRDVLHVEVKGTRTIGTSVVLTVNEVAHAKHHRSALFILHSIRLLRRGKQFTPVGGKRNVIDPWKIQTHGLLKPLSYMYDIHPIE